MRLFLFISISISIYNTVCMHNYVYTYTHSVNGELTFDSSLWETEFRTLYSGLFTDPDNDFAIQDARLQLLRLNAVGQDRIVVPRFMLCDILSQSGRKRYTAPGLDGITSGALGYLPLAAIDTLVNLCESRINGDLGHDSLIADWIHVAISLIPKVRNANTAKKWRSIALTSCLQKVYLAVVTKLDQFYSEPCHHMQYGFSLGKQVMEITELRRLAAQKSTRWGVSLYSMKLDVHRAFDALRHGVILAALERSSCPVRLQLAMLRELAHFDITLNFQGSVWEGITYLNGGKKGGSDTPELRKRALDVALCKAKLRWDSLSLGASFGQEPKSHGNNLYLDGVAWADDIILFSNSLANMKAMFRILVEELAALRLEIKPGSLEVMNNYGFWDHDVMLWEAGGVQHKVCARHSLNILGVTVDESGSDTASIDHRIAQAWIHFMARRKSFCNSIIPLKLRWRRIRDTVFKTLLHGSVDG